MSAAGTPCSECLSTSWLAERLAVDPARLDAMRRAGELIAVREEGSTEWRYPAWQLEGAAPRKGIARIVAAARDAGLDETGIYEALTAPRGLRGEQRLVDLLLEGRDEAVVAALRSSAS
jgi:hypothetical protein